MKINKIFLLGLILMAMLSVAAVSAEDNMALNDDESLSAADDTLAIDEWDDDDWIDDDDEDYDEDEDEDEDDDWDEDAYFVEVNDNLGSIYYLNDAVIASLTLPEDAYGNLAAFEGDYDSGDYLGEFKLVKGFVEVRLSDLNLGADELIGDHYFSFVYEGDDYEVIDGEIVINIVDYELKGPSTINLGESATYTLDLHRNINGTLYVYPSLFDGDDYIDGEAVYFDVINGVSKAVFSNLKMGMYSYRFDFSEDDYYMNQEVFLDVCPKITVKNRITIGKDNILTVDLPKDAHGSFSLSLYSSALDDYTDVEINYANGNIKISSIGLTAGDYDITGYEINDAKYGYVNFENTPTFYSTDGIYTSFKAVNPIDSIVLASNFKTLYTAGGVYKVKVTIAGKAAAGARVVFKINNAQVKSTFTDKNGYATLKITKTPGTYKITTIALGKSVTKTLTVKHLVSLKKVTVKKSANSLTIQASLAKVNGKYLKNKWVTFKFNSKSSAKVKTNSKGIAKFTVSSKTLSKLKVGKKVTYHATYLKDTVKQTVIVKR